MAAQLKAEPALAFLSLARGALARLVICVCLGLAYPVSPAGADTLALALEQGPFDSPLVKKAILSSAAWHQLAETSGLTVDEVVVQVGGRDRRLDPAVRNVERAKELMAEAGYPGGGSIQFLLLYEKPLARLAALVARHLEAIGLKAELGIVTPETLDATIRSTRYVTGQHSIELPYLLLTLDETVAPQPQRLADLVVDRPSVEYDSSRQRLTVLARVANQGDRAAGRHHLAILDRNRAIRFPLVSIEPLKPGEDRLVAGTIEIGHATLGQTLILQAEIDVEREIRESNESNNQSDRIRYRLPDPVLRRPDLVVGRPTIVYDPSRQRLTVRTSIANQGDRSAGAHHLAILERNGAIRFAAIRVEAIKPGEKRTLTGSVEIPEDALGGTLILQVQADSEGTVEESDEGNNLSDEVRHVLPDPPVRLADLAIGRLTVEFDQQSRLLTVRATVWNQGKQTAATHHLAITDDSGAVVLPATTVEALKPGEKRVVTGTAMVPVGALGHTLILQGEIDSKGAVSESDERNNRSDRVEHHLPEPVQEFPDLVVQSFDVAFDHPSGDLVITVLVANRGNHMAGAHDLLVHDHSETVRLPSVPVPALTPGETRRFDGKRKIPESAFGRTLILQAEIDFEDDVTEADESNNRSKRVPLELPARAQPLADLVVSLLQVSLDETSRSLWTVVTIENRGHAPSLPSVVALLIAPGDSQETIEVPTIVPGGTWFGTRKTDLQIPAFEQNLRVTAVVDPENLLPESDETNNRLQQDLAAVPAAPAQPPTEIWPPALTWPPKPTEIVIAVLATLCLIAFVWAWRRGRAPQRKEASQDRRTGAVQVSYKPLPDRGAQSIEPAGDGPEILFEVALRPRRDPGMQTATLDVRQ